MSHILVVGVPGGALVITHENVPKDAPSYESALAEAEEGAWIVDMSHIPREVLAQVFSTLVPDGNVKGLPVPCPGEGGAKRPHFHVPIRTWALSMATFPTARVGTFREGKVMWLPSEEPPEIGEAGELPPGLHINVPKGRA